MKLLKQYDCVIIRQELQLFCLIEAGIPKQNAAVLPKLKEINGVEISSI